MLITGLLILAAGTVACATAVSRGGRSGESAEKQSEKKQLRNSETASEEIGHEEGYDLVSLNIDREIRRNLSISGGALAFITGSRLIPILLVPGVGLLLLSLLFTMWKVFQQLDRERKIGVTLLDSMAFILPMIMHLWTMAALTGTFIAGARWLSRRTERRSRENLASLFSQQIRTAWVEYEGVLLEVSCSTLKKGDTILVEAGMPIPVDGKVIKGIGRVDQQSLTGEAQPVDKTMGDEVFAATLLLEGRLYIQLCQAGERSQAMELAELLEEVDHTRQNSQSRAEKIIDRWVLATVAASGLAGATHGIGAALAIVYSSIGYPLRYAGPTGILNHMRGATQRGILIRDGRALEKLAEVDIVLFDKTGTLTLSTPAVHRITGVGSFEAKSILRIAATAERRQSHPLASAILQAAELSGIHTAEIDAMEVRPGFGLHVTIDGRDVLVGSARLLASEGIDVSVHAQRIAPKDIVVYVAIDGLLAGFIELSASLREETENVTQALQARGIEVMVLSGDQVSPTRDLAESLRLDGYFAEVVPREKAEIIERIQSSGRKVCFIGDGINDALALQTADVSISLKGAPAIAESAASIVLMDGTLEQLPTLFLIAKSNERNTDRSVGITTVAGVGCMAGVFFFGLGAGAAMGLNLGVITACMLNAGFPLLGAGGQSRQDQSDDRPKETEVPFTFRQLPETPDRPKTMTSEALT